VGSKKKPKTTVVQQGPQYGSAMQESTTTTNQQFTPWASAQPTYDAMAAQMNAAAAAGPQYVGPSTDTQAGWDSGRHAAYTSLGALANTGMENYNYLSRAADVANNPYVQGMMENNRAAAQRSLTEDFLPAISRSAQAAGGMGGSRQGVAQGIAIDRAMRSLLEANNSLAMGAYSQGLSAQQNALGQLGAVQSAQLAPSLALASIGQSQEGYQQAQQDAQWNYLQNLGAAQQYLNPLGSLSSTVNASGKSASGKEGVYAPIPGVASTAATSTYSAGNSGSNNPVLYSDLSKRLKKIREGNTTY